MSKVPMIAIVDDDEGMRDAIQSLVQSLGHKVSTFASADEYLNSEQVHDTSCLISDVQMPGLNGLDLQDHLIARGHRIPIIFLTGYPDDSVRARAIKAGAVDFLVKPFKPDHFVGCIDKALKAA
jgi:FixJ family two-component response regulator